MRIPVLARFFAALLFLLLVSGSVCYAERCEKGTEIMPLVTFAGRSPVDGKVFVFLNQPVNAQGTALDVDNYLDPTRQDGVHCIWTGTPTPTVPRTVANSLCKHGYPGVTVFTWICPQDYSVSTRYEDDILCPGGDDPDVVINTTVQPIPERIDVHISPSAIPRDKCHEATATVTVYGYNLSALQCPIKLDITSGGLLFKNGEVWVNSAQLTTNGTGGLVLQVRSADASGDTITGSLTATYKTVVGSGPVTLGGLTMDLSSDKDHLVTLATSPPQRATITATVGYGGQSACGDVTFLTSHGKFENNNAASYTRALSDGVATAILVTDPQQATCNPTITCRMEQLEKTLQTHFHQPALETNTSQHQIKPLQDVTCTAKVFDATDNSGVPGVICNFHWAYPVNENRQQAWATGDNGIATDILNGIPVPDDASGQLQVNAAGYYGRTDPLKWHKLAWYDPSNLSAIVTESNGMIDSWKVQFGTHFSVGREEIGGQPARWTFGIGTKF